MSAQKPSANFFSFFTPFSGYFVGAILLNFRVEYNDFPLNTYRILTAEFGENTEQPLRVYRNQISAEKM